MSAPIKHPSSASHPHSLSRWGEFCVRWLPAILWMLWIFSASTNLMSNAHTSRFIEPFLRWLIPTIQTDQLNQLHYLIRKAGHVAEYAILAILLWRACGLWAQILREPKRSLCALLLSIAYAATDEFHQLYVASRMGSLADVGIDTFGALLGLLAIWIFTRCAAGTPLGRSRRCEPS